jgi:hypothetical protein
MGDDPTERRSTLPQPPRDGRGNEGASTRPTEPRETGSGAKPQRPSR